MPQTIYFSGSISGGREDAAMYRRIVAALEGDGHRVLAGMVTSEAVGDGGEALSSVEIFLRDMRWLEEVAEAGGVLVAEVSRPSHGVGYEIGAARYRFGIPVICLWRPAFTRRCSGMIAGDEGIRLLEYTDETVGEMLSRLSAALA
ncbi:MAG: nucleoside 2-deoxyribosyltransferase [Thermoanaerobaculia bacterium]